MTDYPIKPPLELVQQWHDECHKVHEPFLVHIANCAAQWAADQQLEMCVAYMRGKWGGDRPDILRAALRPKPPSLKEQALMGLNHIESTGEFFCDGMKDLDTIRRALEAIPDDN